MDCQSCNTRIDYRFLTNCAHCDCEAQATDLPQNYLYAPVEKALTWKQRLINITYVFVAAFAGLISGATLVYFLAAIVYVTFFSGGLTGGAECARGTAVAGLSIISGAFLGTIIGSVFAVKRPLCKGSGR